MQFDATETLGALAKLPPETPKPVEQATTAGGIWRAARNAVPAAVAESAAMVAKGASIAFDDSPDNRGPVRQFGEEVERSLRNVAESYAPDPMTASKAEQVVFGLTRGVGKAVGYGLTTGPAAPLLFGVDEGLTEREKLIRQGVDEAAAGKVGALAGVVNAAGFAIPAAGSTVARTIGLAALAGPASFVAQQAGSREILRAADYESIASSYDPTDALGLALSAIPFGFGAWAMRGRFKTGKPAPEARPAPDAAPVAPDAIPVEPVRAADVSGVSPDIAPASPDVVARSPDIVPEPIVRQEHVDAAMVKNLVDFEDGVKANPPERFEAELWRGPVTENPNFKAWFGESAIVNEDGAPMVVYHGTPETFDSFAASALGAHTNTTDAKQGFFFTSSARDAAEYIYKDGEASGSVMPVYLSMKNPYVTDFIVNAGRTAEFSKILEQAKRDGHDGVVAFLDTFGRESSVFVAFEPTQIKSAIGNSGRFDPNSPSLTDPIPPKEIPANVPTPAKLGTETREAPAPEGKAEVGKGGEGAADAATVAAYKSEAERILEMNPDMVVDVDAQGNKVTAREALEKIRREAAEGTADELGADDAKLVKVAAECALSFGE